MAQLGARFHGMEEVAGSIPARSTNLSITYGSGYPLLAGQEDVGGMPVIVCRGTGTWGPRMRLWSRGEILRIVLRAGSKS